MQPELVDQSYWDKGYEKTTFSIAGDDKPIRNWIESFVKKANGKCFEVGCFPGTYLAVFGGLGYVLNGIDLTPGVEKDLPEWL